MKRLLVAVAALVMVLPSCKNEVPPCNHSWEDGICNTCGKVCQHSWEDGICNTCGKVCQHSWEENVCLICGDENVVYDQATNTYYAATMKGLRAWYKAVKKEYKTNLTLTRDITYTEVDEWAAVRVEGLVEGNGYTIKGWSGKKFILDVQNGGAVQNLHFEDANVTVEEESFGAIIARVDEGCRVSNCHISGLISTNGDGAGIVAYNEGSVTSCINEATIYAGQYGAGGIVGENMRNGKIVACLNLSTSVSGEKSGNGSIVGQNFGSIYGCLGVVSTSGKGAVKATECAGYNGGTVEGCVVMNSMTDVTAEHIKAMNEAIASLGYSYRWVAGENGEAPTLTSAE